MVIRVGSLFAGIGGIDLAFYEAGFKIEWANELDENACNTYSKNFEHKIICKDINNLTSNDLSNVDVITGGFPCQAFSVAGYRKGFSDARGNIVFQLFRLLRDIKPRALLLENVKNLKSHNNGDTLKTLLGTTEAMGYHTKHQVLNTCEYSHLPQNRERLFIVGFRKKSECQKFEFPKKFKSTTPLIKMLDTNVDTCFYYNNSKYYSILKKEMTNKNTCYQWRRKYVRENKSNMCPTLTANMGTGGHNVPLIVDDRGIRKLTPRECGRLQGFSDDFIFPKDMANSKIYKQIGNSVSVPVVARVASNMKKVM